MLRSLTILITLASLTFPAFANPHMNKPMLIREGIDDLGISLGWYVDCIEKTIQVAVDERWRPPPKKEIEVKWNKLLDKIKVIVPGVTRNIVLHFKVRKYHVLLHKVTTGLGGPAARSFKEKFATVLQLCAF